MNHPASQHHVILRLAENFHCEWLTADLVTWSTQRSDAYEFTTKKLADDFALAFNENLPGGTALGRATVCPVSIPEQASLPVPKYASPARTSTHATTHTHAYTAPKRTIEERYRWWDR